MKVVSLRKNTFLIGLFFVLYVAFSFCPASWGADDDGLSKVMKRGKQIIVDGDKVEYFEKSGRIVASGNVVVTYGDVKATCDKIEVNTITRKAFCTGKVRIVEPDGTLSGERVRYDFAKKRGQVISGEINAYPWFGEAETTTRVGDNEYVFHNGYITTCDLDVPHYRIKAKKVRVFPDDKIIATNVVFYVDEVPVLFFPYYYHPIIQSRSKVQFMPGQSTEWGNFVLSSWRKYIIGESRADISVDYRSKKGFGEGANFYYRMEDLKAKGWGEGFFRMYFVQQNGKWTYDPTPFRDEWPDPEKREEGKKVKYVERKMFQWKHRVEFDPSVVGMMEFNKYSDEYFLKDYFYNESTETSPSPENYVSLTSAQENYLLEISANCRFHKFETITQRMPEIKFDVPQQKMGQLPLYYSSESSMVMFDKQYANKSSPCEIVNRFDSKHELSWPINLKLFEVTPYGWFQETMYSRTKQSQELTCRNAVGGGVNASTRVYRIFDVNTNFLGLNINKLRHIVAPSINYDHIEQPNIYSSELMQLDGVDSMARKDNITFSIENKIQTKRPVGGALTSVDLARLMISSEYTYHLQKGKWEAAKKGPYRKHGRFSDFTFDLEVDPYEWLFFDANMEVNRKNLAINKGMIEFSAQPVDAFHMAMGYRYEKMQPNPRNAFTFDVQIIPNPKWKIGIYERFDVQTRIIEEQQFTITRDLHCCELEVSYDVQGSRFFKDEYTLWFAFKVKAFPDLPIGLDRSFSRRKPGQMRPGQKGL